LLSYNGSIDYDHRQENFNEIDFPQLFEVCLCFYSYKKSSWGVQ